MTSEQSDVERWLENWQDEGGRGAIFTGRGFVHSGARQLLLGFAAAGVTFLIGPSSASP